MKFKSTPEQLDLSAFDPNSPTYTARTGLNLRINQLEEQNKFLELIDSLEPELKQIANQYLEKGFSPYKALEQADAMGKINNLPNELTPYADQYLEQGLLPSTVLYRVAVIYWNNGLKKF